MEIILLKKGIKMSKREYGGILSDREVVNSMNNNEIIIHPILDPDEQIQGTKVDLRLGTNVKILKTTETPILEPWAKIDYYDNYTIPLGSPLIIHPGEFVLAPTFESVRIPKQFVGHLEGRSSLGRLGIIVHATASLIDPGFNGVITLEITNLGRVAVPLLPLMRIAAITFSRVEGIVSVSYSERQDAKYKYAVDAGASGISKDYDMETLKNIVPNELKKRSTPIVKINDGSENNGY